MTAAASEYTSPVAARIRGEERAREFLRLLRVNLGDGGELGRALDSITDSDERAGFARVLQKALEYQRA